MTRSGGALVLAAALLGVLAALRDAIALLP
jgi:hypothetical protein